MDQQQSALPLFASEPTSKNSINKTNASAHPLSPLLDCTYDRFPRMVGFFSLAQWQEMELQALIYKYMLVGAPIPLKLILSLRKSLLDAHPFYHQYHHFPSALLQSEYRGRGAAVDPEPGRCRRTDGKKWRCSREVVVCQKYCERHVHRGRRHRSRKHVEITMPTATGCLASRPFSAPVTKQTHSSLSGSPAILDILPLNQRPPDGQTLKECSTWELQGNNAGNRVLRSFFDDWPRSHQDPSSNNKGNARRSATSTTHLSMAITADKFSSDTSLKLSTGNDDKLELDGNKHDRYGASTQTPLPPASWSGWGSHGEASMGGPLAEALRSSVLAHSPTSLNSCSSSSTLHYSFHSFLGVMFAWM